MGGAAGHMAHPFDCREVRNGRDLINFYVKAVNAIPLYEEESKGSSVSVKLDGVNTSFRLQKADNPAGFMFVIDRGGKTPGEYTKYDFEGVTPDNVVQRFKGNEEHGMVQVVNHMSKILNHNLMELKPHVEALGLFERMGPEGVFFDAEYYANADNPEGPNAERGYKPVKNNVNYSQNYIAIHRLSEFYTETKESKTGKISTRRLTRGFYWETVAEVNDLLKQKDQLLAQQQDTVEIDQLIAAKNNELKAKKQEHQEVLDNLAKAVQKHATELDMPFNVYTKIGVRFKQGLTREMVLKRVEEALNKKVPYNYKKVSDEMSIGPTSINEQTGEVEARTLKDLLLSINENPAHVAYYPDTPGFTKDGESVKGKIRTKDGYIKDPKQSAFALQVYEDVMVTGHKTGIGPFDIGNSPRDAEAINSAVILWHAVRHIGNALKHSIMTDVDLGVEGGDEKHEGIVIQSTDICDGIAFKFTGEFIVDNRSGGFGVTPKGEDIPSDSAEALHETKIRYGELLESFMVEVEEVPLQKQQYVILLPGGFKPPTGGHYAMIKYYEEMPDIVKIYVITGHKERKEKAKDGTEYTFTYEQSRKIFNTYGGFSNKVEFLESPVEDKGPIKTCFKILEGAGTEDGPIRYPEITKKFPNAIFSLGAGDKGSDPARIKHFANYFINKPGISNVKTAVYDAAPACEVDECPASASRMRAAYVIISSGTDDGEEYAKALELFKKLLPSDNYYDNVNMILNQQGVGSFSDGAGMAAEGGKLNENFFMADYLFSLVDEVLSENKNIRPIFEQQTFNKADFIARYKNDQIMTDLIKGIISYIPDLKRIPENEREDEILLPFIELIANKMSNVSTSDAEMAAAIGDAVTTTEVSTVAGGLQGGAAVSKGGRKMASHEELLAEFKLRRLIKKAIKIRRLKNDRKLIKEQKDELKLRKLIRTLIVEGDIDADTKPAPYDSTPINMLADAFNQILPVLKSGLRKLAKPEERLSYRTHVLDKLQKTFNNFDALDLKQVGGGTAALGEDDLVGEDSVDTKVDYIIMPSDGSEDERFKPEEVDDETKLEQDFDEFKMKELNPTGARVAFETINDSNIEDTLADKRRVMFDEEDKDQFEFFGMYNADLWLIAYEEELARELGQEPAFSDPVVERPPGAQEIGKGAEITKSFGVGDVDEAGPVGGSEEGAPFEEATEETEEGTLF